MFVGLTTVVVVVVVVVVRPIVCDVTRMGLNQLFVGLAIFVSIC